MNHKSKTTASFQEGSTVAFSKTVGEELNVKYIVEGSGRVIGDQIKVTVQLIDAEEDYHIWAMDTTVVLEEILSLQNNIATT